jgi:1,4-dihydroxy-2-naphthoyl-CoA synthase
VPAGRPQKYATDEERREAKATQTRASKGKAGYRNITVDAEVQALLGVTIERLEAQFGFRPTVSQALRHIIFASGSPKE